MLTRKPLAVQFVKTGVRYGQGGRRQTGPKKPYNTASKYTPKYKYRFNPEFHYKTGVSLDKMIGAEECQFLERIANHRHKTEKPLAITDRVHNLYDILPGVSVGPQFFDHTAGDTTLSGNEEAAKISNFLHLTPPMIKLHCKQLAKLKTPLPNLPANSLKQYTTNYLYAGPSIKHPASRSVSVKVDVTKLGLDPEEEDYFREMLTANKNMELKDIEHYAQYRVPKLFRSLPVKLTLERDQLTITSEQCPTRDQNLSLSYYRLSGFISEARAAKPLTKDFHLSKLFTDFVFDQKEENVLRFEEKQFVKVLRAEEGHLVALQGSPEAVSLAENVLLDVSSDLVSRHFPVPEPFTHFVKYESSTVQEILQTHETVLFPEQDTLVTYADTIENVTEELNDYISNLKFVTVSCPDNLATFVMDPTFLNTCRQYDAQVTLHHATLQLVVRSKDQHLLTSILDSKLKEVQDTVTTTDIDCQHDINWEKLAKQFGAHVSLSRPGTVTVTGDTEVVRELAYFLKQKDAFTKRASS